MLLQVEKMHLEFHSYLQNYTRDFLKVLSKSAKTKI